MQLYELNLILLHVRIDLEYSVKIIKIIPEKHIQYWERKMIKTKIKRIY